MAADERQAAPALCKENASTASGLLLASLLLLCACRQRLGPFFLGCLQLLLTSLLCSRWRLFFVACGRRGRCLSLLLSRQLLSSRGLRHVCISEGRVCCQRHRRRPQQQGRAAQAAQQAGCRGWWASLPLMPLKRGPGRAVIGNGARAEGHCWALPVEQKAAANSCPQQNCMQRQPQLAPVEKV